MRTKLIAVVAFVVSSILSNCAISETSRHESQVIPDQYRGEWNQNPSDCGTGNNDSRLRIDADRIYFWESEGTVSKVVETGPDEIGVTLQLSGEGETWSDELHMRLTDNRDTLVIDGFTRYRCK